MMQHFLIVATGLSRQGVRRQPITVVQGGLRTGTDNVPFSAPHFDPAGNSQNLRNGNLGYDPVSVPRVWTNLRGAGTDRTHAAARVDALSSGGMDDFEIPAFLRKQAD